MKIEKNFIVNIVIGLVLGAVILFGIYGLYRDHVVLMQTQADTKAVVQFLNNQIEASKQNQTQPLPSSTPTK